MELKNAILSAIADIEDEVEIVEDKKDTKQTTKKATQKETKLESKTSDELKFLTNLKERVLVLFEGFQSPNNKNIEAKVDLTLNFLEYLLATTDERINKIQT